MTSALLLLPDFCLILLGFAICRWTALDRPLWTAVERLVYFCLFPALLFSSIVRSPLRAAEIATVAAAGVGIVLVGIAAALALGRWPGIDRRLHASGAQVAFRFNSYIALSLSERLFGGSGLAAMAVLIALGVPLVNLAAVWSLAREGGRSYGSELLRNPLIIATVSGLVVSGLRVPLPDVLAATLQRVGSAALPLGLMAVGAGLGLGQVRSAPGLATALLALRHALLPLLGIALALLLQLLPGQAGLIVLFAALPTAPSAYVLAARMGGDGPFVAGLVTLSTLLGMVSIPLWLALLAQLR